MKSKIITALAVAALASSVSFSANALLSTTRVDRNAQSMNGWYTLNNLQQRASFPRIAIPNYGSPFGIFQYQSYPFHFVNATFDNGTTVYSKLMCAAGVLKGWEQMGANPAYCFGVTKDKKVELIELLTAQELKDSEDWPMSALRGRHYEDISLRNLKFKDACYPHFNLTPDDCFYPARDFPKKAVRY